jgi:high-affinity K+ transport system ATPase subunit B
MVFSLLFTPLGRYLAIGAVVVMVLGGIYFKIRADAVAEIEAAALADALRRTQNAINAGSAVDVRPERLRDDDPNERK